MTINSNYGLLQKQIADECGDNPQLLVPLDPNSGLLSPVQNAIQSAITKWEREPFYFNDFRLEPTIASPFKLAIGQEFYGAGDYAPLATLACIKSIRVLQGTQNRYSLDERDSNYLNDVAVNAAWRGLPTDYSYDANQLRIYPIPDAVYPVGLTGTTRQTALAANGDANVWTQDAFDLIRCEAKLILGRDVLMDEDIEAAGRRGVYGTPGDPKDRGYWYDLKAETTRRHSSRTRIRPSNF